MSHYYYSSGVETSSLLHQQLVRKVVWSNERWCMQASCSIKATTIFPDLFRGPRLSARLPHPQTPAVSMRTTQNSLRVDLHLLLLIFRTEA